MIGKIFNLILLISSIAFFYEYNFGLAVILLLRLVLRLVGLNIKRVFESQQSDEKYNQYLEKTSNVYIRTTINIEEVLKHSSVEELFKKLKKKEQIEKSIKIEEWLNKLLNNYKKKYQKEGIVDQVEFKIRNGNLSINGNIDDYNTILHEIQVPYNYKNGKEVEAKSILTPDIYFSLTIRLVVENGELVLQVGRFDAELTPKMLRKESEGPRVYQTYATVTKFPLMYFSYEHKIPKKFLNISRYASESRKDMFKGEIKEKSKDRNEINNDLVLYNYICATANDDGISYDKRSKKKSILDQKKEEKLKENGFEDQTYKSDYYNPREYNEISYRNKYLEVYCIDQNEFNEKRQEFYLTDYYEESIL